MKRLLVLLPLAIVAAVVVSETRAAAKPKLATGAGPSACGYKSLPIAVGNTWTYRAGSAQVVLKITGVAPGKDWQGKAATVIEVEEAYQGRTLKTEWTCTPTGGLLVGLDSFFFSGEPGGEVGTTYTVTEHDKPWLVPEEQLTGDVAWIENVKADEARADTSGAGAKHAVAKIELERHAQLRGTESAVTTLGQFSAEKVVFELRGRAIIDTEKAEIPIKRPATFWFVKGVGLVKIDDAFDKTWELTETNLIAK